VYLLFRNQLFNDAIGTVLRTHPEIELVGATDRPEQVAIDIAALAPDVILLEEADDPPATADAVCILSSRVPYRLITLRLDKNGMHVWSRTWCQMVRTQDLTEAIISVGGTKL
jgi:DNA-binding NarL/FixJ family response regulator